MPYPTRHPSIRQRARRAPALLLLLAVALAGCRREAAPSPAVAPSFSPIPRVIAGEPRPFLLGFSALPVRETPEAYVNAMNLAANYGEVLLIQRRPDWESFLPGATVADELERRTLAERDALAERNLRLFYAIDVFDPAARERLAGLPERLEGQSLANADLRRALVQEARFIALNYRPAYLAIGSEVNATFEKDPDAYAAFREAYAEAYAEVKSASPDTQVFPTFQYEQFLGLVSWEPPHAPRWRLLDDFAGMMDMFAVTSYPSFVYQVARKIPAEYYLDAKAHTSLPVGLVSVGFASAPAREGLNSSTEAEQRRFLERLLRDADAMRSPLVVWFAGRDPATADSPPLDLIASIGLRTSDDRPKEAWPEWERAVNRPYEPAPATTARTREGR